MYQLKLLHVAISSIKSDAKKLCWFGKFKLLIKTFENVNLDFLPSGFLLLLNNIKKIY